jgi:alcohol dehydrogenase (cytochrome c)/quinohemoprotein ethanol dehydrogenase
MRSLITVLLCAAPLLASAAEVDARRLRAAQTAEPGQWLSYGRDYSEQRYSPLRQINADNVKQLGLAWYGDLYERGGSYEGTPVYVDGRLYVTAPWSKVYAFDAKTGKQLWKYDPQVQGAFAVNACCGIENRGVAVWKDKVIVATLDGRLVALIAGTGKKVWEKQTTDPTKALTISGAPRVADGRVFIGQGGSEFQQRGYMAAYDAENGNELWRWWAVPGDPSKGFEQPELEMAAKTWKGEWWKAGGGGTPWEGIVYDPETDLVIFGTGNGAPWPAEIRSPGGGDNLFVSSIVAVEAKTGKYRWHYQATPMDSWDYDNAQGLVTADLVINGTKKHVVMQASKNGGFYVIEVATGKVQSADLFVPTANWMTGFDADFRPILNPDANYGMYGDRGFHVVPSAGGAHSWQSMAFNRDTGLMYVPTDYNSFPLVAETGPKMGSPMIAINTAKKPKDSAPVLEGSGRYLLAWDPVKRREVWKQRLGSARAAVMTTAGNLVFQGSTVTAVGEPAQPMLAAYRADTGDRVWTAKAGANISGGPSTYTLGGEQYVAVLAGGSIAGGDYWAPNNARLLVFKLGGAVQLPAPAAYTRAPLNPPAEFGDEALRARGQAKYTEFCSSCHANDGRVANLFPDLRYASALGNPALFKAIVIDGALQVNGMVSFGKVLTPEDAEAIRAHVVGLSNQLKNTPLVPGPGPGGPAPPPAAPAAGAAVPAPEPALHQ